MMEIQSMAVGHSPRIGMASRAVIRAQSGERGTARSSEDPDGAPVKEE